MDLPIKQTMKTYDTQNIDLQITFRFADYKGNLYHSEHGYTHR